MSAATLAAPILLTSLVLGLLYPLLVSTHPAWRQPLLAILSTGLGALVSLSLVQSWQAPPNQNWLQLYTANLQLQASDSIPLALEPVDRLWDDAPLEAALRTYQTQRQLLTVPGATSRPAEADDLDVRIGLLQAVQGQGAQAQVTWQAITKGEAAPLAQILSGLWSDPARLLPDAEMVIQNQLRGWFRAQALTRLYQLQQRDAALVALEAETRQEALAALGRLGLAAGLPVLGSGVGLILGLGLGIQALRRRPAAVQPWPVPWDGVTTWQVMVLWGLAFFGTGQVLVPLVGAATGLSLRSADPLIQALYALLSYSALVLAGLGILVASLYPYRGELAKGGWFWAAGRGQAWVWGLGGYLVALPIVLGVSLVNQQLLGDHGGGNPLLPVIAQSQGGLVALIFALVVAILAPFFEETLFRGFFLGSLTQALPVWSAILASSMAFALAHLNLADFLPLTALGIVLGVVYTRSRGLLAPMIIHSLWNSGSLISLWLLGGGQ